MIFNSCLCVFVLYERKGRGGDCQFVFSLWVLIGVLPSFASCRKPCRSRLPQCPQGLASPLGWWASPKPGRCNCAGVSHSSPTQICVGCVLASAGVFIRFANYLKTVSFNHRVWILICFKSHHYLYSVSDKTKEYYLINTGCMIFQVPLR